MVPTDWFLPVLESISILVSMAKLPAGPTDDKENTISPFAPVSGSLAVTGDKQH